MDLKLDDNNDLVFENNQLVLVDGADFVKQLLKQRLQTFIGEWFLDTSLGIPYFQEILKKQVNINAVSNIFKNEILNTPGVIEMETFELDFTEGTRHLSLTFSVRTQTGSITINIEELGA